MLKLFSPIVHGLPLVADFPPESDSSSNAWFQSPYHRTRNRESCKREIPIQNRILTFKESLTIL
jgi:hypothetical protein